jgi:hypothetical protein
MGSLIIDNIISDDIKYRVEINGTLVIYNLEVINKDLLD